MDDIACPFCHEDGFDSVGLAIHFNAGHCTSYDRACRLAADHMDRRSARTPDTGASHE